MIKIIREEEQPLRPALGSARLTIGLYDLNGIF